MKTVIIYYSYSGNTKRFAEKFAEEYDSEIIEIKDRSPRSKFMTYIKGSLAARGQKKVELEPFNADLSGYDKIVIAMPIWAGYPAPPINNIIDILPAGKDVELIMNSGSGKSKGSKENTQKLVIERGCTVTKYIDIKG